jgi:hypothetical protein
MIAEHLVAEKPVKVESAGRVVWEWKEHPSHPDNHLFDCLVGCAVAAAVEGVTLDETSKRAERARVPLKLSELAREKARASRA